jgi:site-specific recombinase XerD
MNYLTKFLPEAQDQESNVLAMAIKIAKESPQLCDLNKDQLEAIAKICLTQRLTDELCKEVDIAGIDYQKEKSIFLMSVSKSNSEKTRTAYCYAIARLEQWCKNNNLKMLGLTFANADDYINYLRNKEGYANGSVLLYARAASSFYNSLERRFASVKNPFRSSRALPNSSSTKIDMIPTDEEVNRILENAPPIEKAIISIMAFRGLRVSGVKNLQLLTGGRYHSFSKAKNINGILPSDCIAYIKKAGLNISTPFKDYTVNAIECRIKYLLSQLAKDGLIRMGLHCHSFRHYAAIKKYRECNNVKQTSVWLGHSNISTTDLYLRGLIAEYEG